MVNASIKQLNSPAPHETSRFEMKILLPTVATAFGVVNASKKGVKVYATETSQKFRCGSKNGGKFQSSVLYFILQCEIPDT